MSFTRPSEQAACTSATSGAHARQRSSAASAVSTSMTSCPAALSTRAIRRRFGVKACVISTRMFNRYPVDGGLIPERMSRMSDQAADFLDVATHLLDQRRRRLEAPLAADAVDELEPQLAAVEVAVEVQQERLDEQAATRDERRAHAHRHRGGPLPQA